MLHHRVKVLTWRVDEPLALSLEHSRLDSLSKVILFYNHVLIGLKIRPLVHLLLSCHGFLSLSRQALIDHLQYILLLHNTPSKLVPFLLDQTDNLVPIRQFFALTKEILLLELVHLPAFTDALA